MTDLVNDILALEQGELTADESVEAMQRIINDGTGWKLQGSMGRSMMAAIEAGDCLLGKEPKRDYWGNFIPSRQQVKDGTEGSKGYVAAAHDEAYAEHMASL